MYSWYCTKVKNSEREVKFHMHDGGGRHRGEIGGESVLQKTEIYTWINSCHYCKSLIPQQKIIKSNITLTTEPLACLVSEPVALTLAIDKFWVICN